MKSTKKLFAALTLTLLGVLLSGCKNVSPQTVQSLTTLAVYELAKDNPKLTKQLREIQPTACAVARSPLATLQDVATAVEKAVKVTPEVKNVIDVTLTIVQTHTVNLGTNVAVLHPYVEAAFCPGIAGALAELPDESGILGEMAKSRNAPPKKVKLPKRFVLVK